MQIIASIDAFSACLSIVAMGFLLSHIRRTSVNGGKMLVVCLLLGNGVYLSFLTVEWTGFTHRFDLIEDVCGAVLPMWWAFMLYALLQQISKDDLRLSESRFKGIVANIPGVVYQCAVDKAWTMEFISDEIEKISGYPSADFLNNRVRTYESIINPDDADHVGRIIHDAINAQRPYELEYRVLHADGTLRWVYERGQAMHGKGDAEIWLEGTIFDVTNRKKSEEEKAIADKEIRQLQKMDAIGQLAGGVAHDFNNMLGGIIGAASMLSQKMKKDDSLYSYVSIINKAGERAAKLTQQLLTFSRKKETLFEPFDIRIAVQGALDILTHSIDPCINVVERLTTTHPIINGDLTQVQAVILNIAINARDAMPEGGTLTVSVSDGCGCRKSPAREERVAPLGAYVEVTVSDTGCGMSERVVERMFEPFFTTKDLGKGVGLGMSMVYGIMQQHAGDIRVVSEPGEGTTITLCFPEYDGDYRVEDHTCETTIVRGSGYVLVIDDEEIIRIATKELLEELGYTVDVACDGQSGVSAYEENQGGIDVVILDLTMPVMRGETVFYALREVNPQVKVLLSSGYSSTSSISSLLSNRGCDFIQKPFTIRDLSQKVSRLLHK